MASDSKPKPTNSTKPTNSADDADLDAEHERARTAVRDELGPAADEVETNFLGTMGLCILLVAFFYQAQIRGLVTHLGVFRTVKPISEFGYECETVTNPLLRGCEDLWFDERERRVYAACQGFADRVAWAPFACNLEFGGRVEGGVIVSVDVDEVGRIAGKGIREAEVEVVKHLPHAKSGFASVLGGGDDSLDLLGFGAQRTVAKGRLQFHLVNQRPKIDAATGKPVDGDYDPSIELFEESAVGSRSFRHIATYTDPLIVRPNRVVSDGAGGFYVSNDHTSPCSKLLWSKAEFVLGGGFTAHCPGQQNPSGACKKVTDGLWGPNGITRNPVDGRIYLPSMFNARIHVYEPDAEFNLTLVEKIQMDMMSDNLSPDRDGNIWTANLPKIFAASAALESKEIGPKRWPSAVHKISRKKASVAEGESEYEWTKVAEDGDAKSLSGLTTAAFDAEKGWIFGSGILHDGLTICKPKSGKV